MNLKKAQEQFPASISYVPIGCGWKEAARALVGGAICYIFNRDRKRLLPAAAFGARVESKILAAFQEKFDSNQKIDEAFLSEHGQEIRDLLHAVLKSENIEHLTSDEWIRLLCYAMPILRSIPYETQIQPDCKIVGKLARSVIVKAFPKAEDKYEAERFRDWLRAVIYERLGLAMLPLSHNPQKEDRKRHGEAVRHALKIARDDLCAFFDHKDLSPHVRENLRERITAACEQIDHSFRADNKQADPTRESISWAEEQSVEIARQFARSLTINLCGVIPGDKSTGIIDLELEERLFFRIKKHLRSSVLDAVEKPLLHRDDFAPSYEAALRALQEEDVSTIAGPVAWIRHAFTVASLQYSLHVIRSKKSKAEITTLCAVSDLSQDLFKIFSETFFPEANAEESEEFTNWLATANSEILVETIRSCKSIKNGKEFEERFHQELLARKFYGKCRAAFMHDDLSQSLAHNIKEREQKALTRLLREGPRLIAESERQAKTKP